MVGFNGVKISLCKLSPQKQQKQNEEITNNNRQSQTCVNAVVVKVLVPPPREDPPSLCRVHHVAHSRLKINITIKKPILENPTLS